MDKLILIPLLMGLLAAIVRHSATVRVLSLIASALLLGQTAWMYMHFETIEIWQWIWTDSLTLIFAPSQTGLLFAGLLWALAFLMSLPVLRERMSWTWFWIAMFGASIALLSKDAISFFMGWEVMTWSVFLVLLRAESLTKSQLMSYLLYGVGAGFALLASFVLLKFDAPSFALSDLALALQGLPMESQLVHFVLLWGAFLVKIATMPLHLWLPGTYENAPDRFTMFLSAALSKMGIFGAIVIPFAWFLPILSSWPFFVGTSIPSNLLAWMGGITSFAATFMAIRQKGAKALLAWSSVAQLGYALVGLGLANSLGLAGAVYHSLNHGLINALLFLAVASVIHQTGTDRFDHLGAMISRMPIAFLAVLMGIIGLAGMPPLSGFAGKWLIYNALLEQKSIPLLLVVIASSTAAFLYCYRLIYGIFLGQPTIVEPQAIKEIPWSHRIGLFLLMAMLMALGMFPGSVMPFINAILVEAGLMVLPVSGIHEVLTPIGHVAGSWVMVTFGVSFVVILLLFSLHRVKTRHVHRLDIAYAGEAPTEKTPLHFGLGMGYELDRIPWVGWVNRQTVQPIYDWCARQISGLGSSLARFYSAGPRMGIFLAIVIWIVIALVGGQK